MGSTDICLVLKIIAFAVVLYILRLERFKRYDWQHLAIDGIFGLLFYVGYLQIIETAMGIGFTHSPLHSATLEAAGALRLRELIARHEGLTNLAYIVWTSYFGYWIHRAFHKVELLWELHKVHHSATRMTGLSQFRDHPAALFIGTWATTIMITLILPETGPRFALYFGTFSMIYLTIVHSEWKASWGWASLIFTSPLAHQIHHSANLAHFNSNFGTPFSVWDRVHGTYVDPMKSAAPASFGVDDVAPNDLRSLFINPVVRAAKRLLPPIRSPRLR